MVFTFWKFPIFLDRALDASCLLITLYTTAIVINCDVHSQCFICYLPLALKMFPLFFHLIVLSVKDAFYLSAIHWRLLYLHYYYPSSEKCGLRVLCKPHSVENCVGEAIQFMVRTSITVYTRKYTQAHVKLWISTLLFMKSAKACIYTSERPASPLCVRLWARHSDSVLFSSVNTGNATYASSTQKYRWRVSKNIAGRNIKKNCYCIDMSAGYYRWCYVKTLGTSLLWDRRLIFTAGIIRFWLLVSPYLQLR